MSDLEKEISTIEQEIEKDIIKDQRSLINQEESQIQNQESLSSQERVENNPGSESLKKAEKPLESVDPTQPVVEDPFLVKEENKKINGIEIDDNEPKTLEEALERELMVDEPPILQEQLPTLAEAFDQCGKDEYLVKTIDWKNKKVRIITQNENGPCPLVAISNVLFLRGDLVIQPADREVVTFEYLVDRLADYLLNHAPKDEAIVEQSTNLKRQGTSERVLTYRHNLDSAFSILPNLKKGLDVNVQFDSIYGFEPTAELAMFDMFNVNLVHGWIADPQDQESYRIIVNKFGTYNKMVESIVQMDMVNRDLLTPAEEETLHEGFIANEFLRDTATQLTYYGLEVLLDSIPKDSLCVLFRNNHFCTVYRNPNLGLYMLVTDSGLVKEKDIVWESLGDVDQSTSEFVNGMFKRPNIQESPPRLIEQENIIQDTDLDYAIAISLQDQQQRQSNTGSKDQLKKLNVNSKKKDNCIIQ